MDRSISRKRPWLAAVLAALGTGFGHLYLRRWRRAIGWVAVLSGVAVLFVDPAALDALVNSGTVDPQALAPLLVAGAFSVADAYVLAHAHNIVAQATASADGQLIHCPNCGRELDPELDFCQWCTAEVGELAPESAAESPAKRSDDPSE
ncbi:DUF7575 domain-containing protein [Halosimplex sp. J119]